MPWKSPSLEGFKSRVDVALREVNTVNMVVLD